MRVRFFAGALALLLACAGTAAAQGTQTGTIRGVVTTPDKASVAGVTVTITSTALQAERTTMTEADGSFLFLGLPPGTYTLKFAKATLKDAERRADVPLGGVADVNLVMDLAGRTETVTVTADTPTILTTPTVGANITQKTVNSLATPRGLVGIASLAPAVTMNTPNANQLTINGAFAYDNIFLINGIDINDNLFGSPQRLFIEDAIQEVQVLTSGISAEYGRFGGGVVNAITKSGGNNFSGSFRMNFSNPTWSTLTPFDVDNGVTFDSKLNTVYEATLGGPIRRDRIWFFGATRIINQQTPEAFPFTGIQHTTINNNRRGEAKITASPVANHTLQLSYINNHTTVTEAPFGFSIDPHTEYSGREPNSIFGGTWRGLVGGRYFAEAGYSQRRFSFLDEGGTSTNIVDSPIIGLSKLVHYNAPYFDATDPEDRNNNQLFGTLSFSATRWGRHDFKAGYEWFRSHHTGGNSQSSTNFVFDADYLEAGGVPVFDANGRLIPVFEPGVTLIENWMPVRGAVNNTDTHSLFLQDHWAVNRRLSLDLGVRFEKVRSEATGNILGVDTSAIVPRLALGYDLLGDGKWIAHATYGHYSGKYNETLIGGNNNVGNPDLTLGFYVGPPGQGRDFAPGFNPDNYETFFGRFPTANVTVAEGMSSPITREFTASVGGAIADRIQTRVSYIRRSTNNFIDDVIDIANGTTEVVRNGTNFGTFTNIIYTNTNVPQRRYQAVVLQGSYHIRPNWTVHANWTVQLENDGTIEGEATNQPGLPSVFLDYPGVAGVPSIYDPARHAPDGRLGGFQRSKLRAWMIYDWDLGRWGTLTSSGFVRYDSPLHYSLVATGEPLSQIQENLLIAAGYPDSPGEQAIFFGPRGSEKFNATTLFDASFNYNIPVFRSVRPFVKFDIFNLFDNQNLLGFDTTIFADWDGPVDALGIPTTFIRADSFGTPVSAASFPTPFQGQSGGRTFLLAAGIRF